MLAPTTHVPCAQIDQSHPQKWDPQSVRHKRVPKQHDCRQQADGKQTDGDGQPVRHDVQHQPPPHNICNIRQHDIEPLPAHGPPGASYSPSNLVASTGGWGGFGGNCHRCGHARHTDTSRGRTPSNTTSPSLVLLDPAKEGQVLEKRDGPPQERDDHNSKHDGHEATQARAGLHPFWRGWCVGSCRSGTLGVISDGFVKPIVCPPATISVAAVQTRKGVCPHCNTARAGVNSIREGFKHSPVRHTHSSS